MYKKKNFFFGVVMIAIMILTIELGLRVLGIAVPEVEIFVDSESNPIAIPDLRLGIRPNPEFPGHDANGFRNECVPEQVDIVAMGDSQTYGMGVRKNQAWPHQLSRMLGKQVYSMAFGSYGPLHCQELIPKALSLKPQLIILAFYAGNDLYDAFQLVYGERADPHWIMMKNSEQSVLEKIQRAEEKETLISEAFRLTARVLGKTVGDVGKIDSAPKRSFLSRHSRIVRLVEMLIQELSIRPAPQKGLMQKRPDQSKEAKKLFWAFENEELRTVFNPSYRQFALDRSDPRIEEGFRLCLEGMRLMAQTARRNSVSFAVLLIPTKELVFKNVVSEALGENSDERYQRLITTEENVLEDVKNYLEDHDIPVIDCRDALRQSLQSGPLPYRTTNDGHPTPAGYRAIAGEVALEIDRLDLGEEMDEDFINY